MLERAAFGKSLIEKNVNNYKIISSPYHSEGLSRKIGKACLKFSMNLKL
jgi:hypothetical protein